MLLISGIHGSGGPDRTEKAAGVWIAPGHQPGAGLPLPDIEVGIGALVSGEASSKPLLSTCGTDGVKLVWAGTGLGNAQTRRVFERTGAGLNGEQWTEYEWEIPTP